MEIIDVFLKKLKASTNFQTLCNGQEWLQRQVPPGTTFAGRRHGAGSSCWVFLATTRGEAEFSSINCLDGGEKKPTKTQQKAPPQPYHITAM